MRRFSACLLIAALVAVAASPAITQIRRWDSDYFSNATVITQQGRSLKFYDDVIKDKIVVISFIYTSCRDICPLVTARLQQLRELMAADGLGRNATFVSITIDPEHDRPENLKAHAESFKAAPDWLFLTGSPDDIRAINYKLGERSRNLTEHKNEIVLGNDRTGSWARDSIFTDLNVLARTIDQMDASARAPAPPPISGTTLAKVDVTMDLLPGQALFIKACAGCHTIGNGDRVGPDLKGLTSRRERPWLSRMMIEPHKLLAEKDPTALALVRRFKAVRMPVLGLSENDVADLIAYIDVRTYQLQPVRTDAPAHDHSHHAKKAVDRKPVHNH